MGHEWWWKWESPVVQKWSNVIGPTYDEAYDAALAQQVAIEGMPLKYDQFALERVCLGKWYAIPRHTPPPLFFNAP